MEEPTLSVLTENIKLATQKHFMITKNKKKYMYKETLNYNHLIYLITIYYKRLTENHNAMLTKHNHNI
jgi:hypothetical protein